MRWTLLLVAVLPVWIGGAVVLFRSLSRMEAAKHLVLIAAMGMLLVELALIGFRKIPFACSYLPGKSRVHVMMTSALFFVPMVLTNWVDWQQQAVAKTWLFVLAVAGVAAAIVAIRALFPPDERIQFEEFASDELVTLDL